MKIPTKVSGKVLLYTSHITAEPPLMTMWREVTPNLPAILQDLSGHYSPIQSKLFFCCHFFVINYFVEFNYHIYVQDDNMWSGKGQFNNVVQDYEPIKWDANVKGDVTFHLNCNYFFVSDIININIFVRMLRLILGPLGSLY